MLWVRACLLLCWQETPLEIPVFTAPHTPTPHTVGSAEQSKQQGTDPAHILPWGLLLWQGLSQIPFHILASPEILIFSFPTLAVCRNCVQPLHAEDPAWTVHGQFKDFI